MSFQYPQSPGFKATGTSRDAAVEVAPRAAILRERVLAMLRACDLTADEVAERLDEDCLSVRPRVTEIFKQGLIRDTGVRRRNRRSGKNAIVWGPVVKGQGVLFQ